MRRPRRTVLALAVVVGAAAALLGSELRPPRAPPQQDWTAEIAATAAALPAPPAPAIHVPRPRRLRHLRDVSTWAPVIKPVAARAAPSPEASLLLRLGTATPEGTTNIVRILGARARHGALWLHVSLPMLPNGTTGWVPRSALGGYGVVTTRLVIDLDRLRATLYRDGRPIFGAPVGVGTASSPTPLGHFYVRDRLTSYASPFYGPVAFGTSARSAATDWPAGSFVGIHGTDRPDLVPGRVSHGCIRLRNDDILELSRLMPVGTPVIIRRQPGTHS
jgi:hypothetical protein